MKKKIGIVIILSMLISGCSRYPASEIIFDDTYCLENADNIEFVFAKDSTLKILQKGIYQYKENEEGQQVLQICLDDISRELPEDYGYTEYLVEDEGNYISMIYTSKSFDLEENPMELYFIKGKDELLSGEYFNGSYQIGSNSDNYQYIFKEDGSMVMQIKQYYYAKDEKIKLSDGIADTEYVYEVSEDKLIIKNSRDDSVLNLHKKME